MNGAWRAIVAALASGLIATGPGVAAESPARTNADDLRGGWVAEVDGTRHILILKVREEQVSGIYCAVDCSDPSHLEFVDRGTLGADGVRFEIQRNGPRGEARTRVAGRIENGRLILSLTPPAIQGRHEAGAAAGSAETCRYHGGGAVPPSGRRIWTVAHRCVPKPVRATRSQ